MNYERYVEENKDRQVKTLQELVSIKSVAEGPVMTEAGEKYPFGQGVQDAFAYMLKIGRDMGFDVVNTDNYGGHIEFGDGVQTVGIPVHLDVIDEGEGWSFDPYSGAAVDGYIYGRGTSDDKGPAVAVLFAMKALKDAGYEPKKKVRLILGLDEERKWEGMEHYLARAKHPDFGFTPDGSFPAVNGEKGILAFELAKRVPKTQAKGLQLRSLAGSEASNGEVSRARAVVRSEDAEMYEIIKNLAGQIRNEKEYKIFVKGVGKSLEITAEGVCGKSERSEEDRNAISEIMEFLGHLNFVNDEINDFIEFYNRHIGFEINGKEMGCGFSDETSGELTLRVGKAEYKKEAITLTVEIKYPVTYKGEQIYEAMMPLIEKYEFGIIKLKDQKPIYMDPETPLVKTLTETYKHYTDDGKSKPVTIGDRTYARVFKNTIAFGAMFPGEEEMIHKVDERLSIDRFIQATKIYAEAILKLTSEDFRTGLNGGKYEE